MLRRGLWGVKIVGRRVMMLYDIRNCFSLLLSTLLERVPLLLVVAVVFVC